MHIGTIFIACFSHIQLKSCFAMEVLGNDQCTLEDFTAGSLATLSFALFSIPVASFGFLSLGETFVLAAVAPRAIFSLEGLLLFLTGLAPLLLGLSLSSLSGNFGTPYFFRIKLT